MKQYEYHPYLSTEQLRWLVQHGDRDSSHVYFDDGTREPYVFMGRVDGGWERVFIPKYLGLAHS